MGMCNLGQLIIQCSEICLLPRACQQKKGTDKNYIFNVLPLILNLMLKMLRCFSKYVPSIIIKVGQCLYLRNAITRNKTELNTYFNLTAKLREIFYVSQPSERGLASPRNTCKQG